MDRKCPPPPFGSFPKIHPFWSGEASLRLIPFFNEIFLSIKIIQEKVEVFKLRRSIDANLDKNKDNEEVWGNVLDTTNQINRAEFKLEKRDQARMRIKICSSIGDILQVSVLAILLLRADLRIRGALIDQQMIEAMGGRNSDGGTPGKKTQRTRN